MLLLQLKFLFSSKYFFQIFLLWSHEASGFFHSILFSFSHTFVTSPPFLLHPFFPILPSLFWLSITKSNAFALSLSSDSLFNCCLSIILFTSCCSIFNLLNTFSSFSSQISICSFWLVYIYFFYNFIIYHYCVVCLMSYTIYFMIFLCYILPFVIIYYWFSSLIVTPILSAVFKMAD